LQSGAAQAKEGRMKTSSLFALSTALLGLALTGCEPHSFEETKALHLEHGKHHDEGHGEEHGEGHGDAAHGKDAHAKDDHAKDAHGEKAPEVKLEATKEEPRKTGI
jgi:hypothetical protein